MLITIVAVLVVLGGLIFFHELGNYLRIYILLNLIILMN